MTTSPNCYAVRPNPERRPILVRWRPLPSGNGIVSFAGGGWPRQRERRSRRGLGPARPDREWERWFADELREGVLYIDFRVEPVPAQIETDICIIGAGAAGIALAREFIGSPYGVCLVESGGLEHEQAVQELYHGTTVGRHYPPGVTRLRFFGGTTNHWGGTCRPLDPHDFEKRDWVSHSGWPITRAELDPFYARAQKICELGPYRYGAEHWAAPGARPLPMRSDRIFPAIFQLSTPTRFGKKYRDELASATNVTSYLHANALRFNASREANRVSSVDIRNLDGREARIRARAFVLATGGIENARLLLLSNREQPHGLGNANGLVGRFFMDHPIIDDTAEAALPSDLNLSFFTQLRDQNGARVRGILSLRPEVQQERHLLNAGFMLSRSRFPAVDTAKSILAELRSGQFDDDFFADLWSVVQDFDQIAEKAYGKVGGPQAVRVKYWSEPQPNPESRITLAEERDKFGQRRVQVHWALTEQDRRNLVAAHRLLAEELGAAGLGRLRLRFEADSEDWPEEIAVRFSFHQMGTTRMAASPAEGVVDRDCRVHGVANLFVAGSSVFPTAGHANPTLTIVALALRLADHLRGQL